MNVTTKVVLCLSLLSAGTASAWLNSEETAFIDAVRDRKMEVVYSLIDCVQSQEAWDRALRRAARNTDVKLYKELYKYASRKGKQRAHKSLMRRIRKQNVVIHVKA